MKPLVCDLPYPSDENLLPDIRSGKIIAFAYASLKSELTAILQYVYHHFHFAEINADDAQTLMSIATAEMTHLDILGKTMLKLGVNPRYVQCPDTDIYFNSSAVSCSKVPAKMLMDDIQGELNAIADYQKMLFVLKNEQVAAIIQRIVLDEQLHLQTLKEMLEKYAK